MLVSMTVGRVDAGVAVLLTEDKRHIEFPSILLPASITSGSIVDITVKQNHTAEQKTQQDFEALQERILNTYGLSAPTTPVLRLRNATQTSLVLEWDPIQLATSTLRSLSLYRNGSKAGNIPRPMEMLSTKISGLAVDTEYSFYLVLRTSGGTYQSETLTVKTHKMTDLTGIAVTPGVLPQQLRDSLEVAVERIGCKLVDTVRIETTHFVCTEGRGKDWEKAVEMNIPVVRPEWLEGCEREGKIVGVRSYYLDANPKHREVGSNPSLTPQRDSTASPTGVAAAAAATSQTSLPSRPKTPEEADADVGEPGPEVPPTPPPKSQVPPPSVPPKSAPIAEVDEDEESSDDSAQQKATSKEINVENDHASSDDSDDTENGRNSKVEESTIDTGGEMEDVAL